MANISCNEMSSCKKLFNLLAFVSGYGLDAYKDRLKSEKNKESIS